jgi:hypothetical protein
MLSKDAKQKVSRQPVSAPKGNALLAGADPGDLGSYFDILERYGYRVRTCKS